VLAGRLQLPALVRKLVKEPGVLDRQGRLRREGAQQLDGLGWKVAGRLRDTTSDPISRPS
jgi:hypothetical protein